MCVCNGLERAKLLHQRDMRVLCVPFHPHTKSITSLDAKQQRRGWRHFDDPGKVEQRDRLWTRTLHRSMNLFARPCRFLPAGDLNKLYRDLCHKESHFKTLEGQVNQPQSHRTPRHYVLNISGECAVFYHPHKAVIAVRVHIHISCTFLLRSTKSCNNATTPWIPTQVHTRTLTRQRTRAL